MSACPPIVTGNDFLERALTHIDCQAQVIGSYGYVALGQPGSVASLLVTGLLTLFVAFFGIRLLFGPRPDGRDVVSDVLKIGIVLALAFSWPAFRTVIYDVTLKGPAEIASVIQASSSNGGTNDFTSRLQKVDNDLLQFAELGAGRNEEQFIGGQAPTRNLAGTNLQDENAFGSARLFFLSSVMGTLALLRIAAGLLLALAPIVAGLYFFAQSRGIFAGWLKGLVFTIAGSVGATIILAVQLAVVEPWLADAIRLRGSSFALPSAPTEIYAIMLAFAIVQIAMLWLMAKVVFYRGWLTLPEFALRRPSSAVAQPVAAAALDRSTETILRAERIRNSVENSVRRESFNTDNRVLSQTSNTQTVNQPGATTRTGTEPVRLGSSYRRTALRTSRIARLRDRMS